MAGYDYDAGMSNNAVAAYDNGLVTASKIKGVPAKLVEQFCRYEEKHHASKMYNFVKFYNPRIVRAKFGLSVDEDYEADPAAVEALAQAKEEKKFDPIVFFNCTVNWLEWSGSQAHPRATECKADGAAVEVKGQTAKITLADGRKFTKRLTTRGFSYSKNP